MATPIHKDRSCQGIGSITTPDGEVFCRSCIEKIVGDRIYKSTFLPCKKGPDKSYCIIRCGGILKIVNQDDKRVSSAKKLAKFKDKRDWLIIAAAITIMGVLVLLDISSFAAIGFIAPAALALIPSYLYKMKERDLARQLQKENCLLDSGFTRASYGATPAHSKHTEVEFVELGDDG
jgi:hypothetical protein